MCFLENDPIPVAQCLPSFSTEFFLTEKKFNLSLLLLIAELSK